MIFAFYLLLYPTSYIFLLPLMDLRVKRKMKSEKLKIANNLSFFAPAKNLLGS